MTRWRPCPEETTRDFSVVCVSSCRKHVGRKLDDSDKRHKSRDASGVNSFRTTLPFWGHYLELELIWGQINWNES